MTQLHAGELKERLHTKGPGRLFIAPLLDEDAQLGPTSIDVRLGTDFLALSHTRTAGLDPASLRGSQGDLLHDRIRVRLGRKLWLHPGRFLLGSTLEFVRIPSDLAGLITGKSTWARLGLVVENAGLVHPGFAGSLTFEIVNMSNSPIALYPGSVIAQVALYALSGPSPLTYAGVYHGAPFTPQLSRWERIEQEIRHIQGVGDKLRHGLQANAWEGAPIALGSGE